MAITYVSNAYHCVVVAISTFQKHYRIFSFSSREAKRLFWYNIGKPKTRTIGVLFVGVKNKQKKMKMKGISRKLKMQFTRSIRQFQRSKYRNYYTSNVYHSVAVVIFAFQKDCGGSKDFFREIPPSTRNLAQNFNF